MPFVVPDVLKYEEHPTEFPAPETAAIWSDAAVWVPWALWQAYGDPAVLADQYDSMAAHVRRVESLLSPSGLWDTGFQFGDWLDPQAPPDQPFEAQADNGVVATACLYRSARIVAEAAALRGTTRTQSRFDALADRTRAAFTSTTSTTTARPQRRADRLRPGDRLRPARRRRAARGRATGSPSSSPRTATAIATGFAGTPFVTDALTTTGHLDDGLPAAARARVPVLAVPGHHGRDDHLGTLGLDAARRHASTPAR